MDLNKLKKVHCLGAGGIGVSAIAKLLLQQGVDITGYDKAPSEITDELLKRGAVLVFGEEKAKLTKNLDLVLYSAAVPEDDPQRQQAKKLGLNQLSYPEFLAELTKNYETVAVSGTHGKSTTTAMIGLILEEAGLDPMVIMGSKLATFPLGNLRIGQSDKLVVEACEHGAHMTLYNADVAVVTNIEKEHLDYYENLGNIKSAFEKFVGHVPSDGLVVLNADDNLSKDISFAAGARVVTFGLASDAHLKADQLKVQHGRQIFRLMYQGKDLGFFSLRIPGSFNIMNALAASLTALEMGVKPNAIKDALSKFDGLWRRFQPMGHFQEAEVFSDYGHHPTEIAATIKAAKEFYPGKRLLLVFQPHQYHRTKVMFDDFVKSFSGADALIISEIFDVAGREAEADRDVSSKQLVKEVSKEIKDTHYAKDLAAAKELITKLAQANDLIMVMGAGDIYNLAKELVAK